MHSSGGEGKTGGGGRRDKVGNGVSCNTLHCSGLSVWSKLLTEKQMRE